MFDHWTVGKRHTRGLGTSVRAVLGPAPEVGNSVLGIPAGLGDNNKEEQYEGIPSCEKPRPSILPSGCRCRGGARVEYCRPWHGPPKRVAEAVRVHHRSLIYLRPILSRACCTGQCSIWIAPEAVVHDDEQPRGERDRRSAEPRRQAWDRWYPPTTPLFPDRCPGKTGKSPWCPNPSPIPPGDLYETGSAPSRRRPSGSSHEI